MSDHPSEHLACLPACLLLWCLPATVLPQQVLLGINFYGYSFARPGPGSGGRVLQEAITADKYLAALKRHRPKLSWKVDEAEHVAKYKACRSLLHTLLPPHPAAIHERMHANNQLGSAVQQQQ
jgi:hypothetical protein